MTAEDIRRLVDTQAEELTRGIVVAWRRMAESEVWLSLPPVMTFDDLPNVVRAIANAALIPRFERGACQKIVYYSALHGDHRNAEGFQEACIYTEYHLLRRSLWTFLREKLDPTAALEAITRADAAISLACMAGLRGFHRQTFEQRGDWPAARDRLLEDWPLMGQ